MPATVTTAQFEAMYQEWNGRRLTQAVAAKRLGVCERTFRRYVERYRAEGAGWLDRASEHHPPDRRAPQDEVAALEVLYSERHSGWSVAHFYEMYRDEHRGKRSYEWVKSQLQTAGLVKKEGRRVSCSGPSNSTPREPESRMPREGELLHHVGSRREWIPGKICDLIVTVDDATNRVHSGFFVNKRGIWSVFRAVREIVTRKGLFNCLSLGLAWDDRNGVGRFDTGARLQESHLSRAMAELRIDLSSAVPLQRVRSVRLFRTLRGRLPRELAAEGITAMEEANALLRGFWARHNLLCAAEPTETPAAFDRALAGNQVDLRDVLCLKHRAAVGLGDYVISAGKKLSIPTRVRQRFHECQQLRIHEYEDGALALLMGDEKLAVLDRHAYEPTGR